MQTNIALMYSESIEKLKGVLQAMQYASQKRENLEKQLREQLQSEIDQLKGGTGASASAGKATLKQRATPSELQQQILQLEAEVAKVCLYSRFPIEYLLGADCALFSCKHLNLRAFCEQFPLILKWVGLLGFDVVVNSTPSHLHLGKILCNIIIIDLTAYVVL